MMALMAVPAAAEDAPIPSLDEARKQIEARDAALFEAAFEVCDPARLVDLLTEDFRMLHDLAGLVVPDRAAFVGRMEQQCAARGPGGDQAGYKNRRQLVPGSRTITPLGEWGMLEGNAALDYDYAFLRTTRASTQGSLGITHGIPPQELMLVGYSNNFIATQGSPGGVKRRESQTGIGQMFDETVILLNGRALKRVVLR